MLPRLFRSVIESLLSCSVFVTFRQGRLQSQICGNNVSSSKLSRGLELTGFGLPSETMSENDERFREYLARQRSKATTSAQLREIASRCLPKIAREWQVQFAIVRESQFRSQNVPGRFSNDRGPETGPREDRENPHSRPKVLATVTPGGATSILGGTQNPEVHNWSLPVLALVSS